MPAMSARSAAQLPLQELLQSPSPEARAPRRKDLLVPPSAHPAELTPQSRVMGDFLQTPVLCSKLGLRQRRKSSNSNLHPNPKSADWGLLDPALCTVLYLEITHTTDMTTEQHRGRERATQALGSVSRGHQTVQVCGHIPRASSKC